MLHHELYYQEQIVMIGTSMACCQSLLSMKLSGGSDDFCDDLLLP